MDAVRANTPSSIPDNRAYSLAASPRRWPISYRTIETIAIVTDALVIVSACICWRMWFNSWEGSLSLLTVLSTTPLVCALFIPAAKLRQLYHPSALFSWNLQAWNVTLLWLGVATLLGITALALDLGTMFPLEAGVAFILIGLVGLLGLRASWYLLIEKGVADCTFRSRKVVLLTQGSSLSGVVPDLERYGFHIEHILPFGSAGDDLLLVRRQVDQAIALSRGTDIEELIIAADAQHWDWLKPHLECLRQLPLPISLIPHGCLGELLNRPTLTLGPSIVVEIQAAPLTLAERLMKRLFDLVCAGFGLMVLSPLLLLVAVLIKLDSPGAILFRQMRGGFNSKPFKICKFRTMTALEDGETVQQAKRDDNRVTKLGRWLRRTSIDELPQLFNVLKGEMSIVGPRPHATSHDNQFGQLISDYAFRRRMKPGVTGLAQVSGYRGATPQVDLMDRRVRLDLQYIEHWSIWLDIQIIARTFIEVVRGRNAW